MRQSQAGRGERDAVESRKSRPGRDLRSRKSPEPRLKIEGQPKRRTIQRPEKLPDKVEAPTKSGQAGGASADPPTPAPRYSPTKSRQAEPPGDTAPASQNCINADDTIKE